MLSYEVSQNAFMPTNDEKVAFSKRLEFALRRSPEPVQGATELALRFNLRHQGNAVSPQTTHKWLSGRAIPTNDKLATIAKWLNVGEHWLHYGAPPAKPTPAAKEGTTQAAGQPPHVGEHQPDYGPLPAKPTRMVKEGTAKGVGKPPQEAINLALKILALPLHRRYLVEELVEQLQQDVG